MKLLLPILGACILFAGCAPVKTDAPSAQRQIQPLMDAMAVAANAHDTDAYMAFYQHSPSLIFAIDGRIIRGWDALHAQQLIWWKNGKSDVVYTPSVAPEFEVLTPDLVVSTQMLSSRRTAPDGKISTGTFVVTSVWKRLPQGWRIVYGHESWAR